MPYTLLIDPEVNCMFIKHVGAFDFGNIAKSSEDRLNHPDHKMGMDYIHDFSEQQIPPDLPFHVVAGESKRIVRDYNLKFGRCKAALVAGDAQSYAKLHQFIEAARFTDNPVERRAFRDMEKAKDWIGLPADYEIIYPEG